MGTLKDKDDPITNEDRLSLLKKVIGILETYDIDYWLEYGTLLGCYRDHAFIKYDADIDIGTYAYADVKQLKSSFEKQGLKVEELYEWTDDMSSIFQIYSDKTHVDIYHFTTTDKGTVAKHNRFDTITASTFRHLYLQLKKRGIKLTGILKFAFKFSHRRNFFYPQVETQKIPFYDIQVRIPKNAEYHLELMYGKTWKTPRRDDVSGTENLVLQKGKYSYYRLKK